MGDNIKYEMDFIEKLENLSLTPADFLSEPEAGIDESVQEKCKTSMRLKMELFVQYIQAVVVRELEKFDTEKFKMDKWFRKEGGYGLTSILQNGTTFEKAGVNVSVVNGDVNQGMLASMKARMEDLDTSKTYTFFATGVSSVIHPVNPYIPTLHFNYRYFEMVSGDSDPIWWFGGGTDMTPYYCNEDDFKHFHSELKTACDVFGEKYYPKFKKWADDYFFNTHREEHRGIGGIFFDDFNELPQSDCFNFISSCAQSILPGYVPIIENNKDLEYGQKEKNWQLLRRGRYVEFNLVYDRGTKFGLHTPGARIESIMMSLPLLARWEYMPEFEEDSEEVKMSQVLKTTRDWV